MASGVKSYNPGRSAPPGFFIARMMEVRMYMIIKLTCFASENFCSDSLTASETSTTTN